MSKDEDRMILRQLADAGFIPDNVIDKLDEITKKAEDNSVKEVNLDMSKGIVNEYNFADVRLVDYFSNETRRRIVEFLTHADLSNQCYCLTQLEADWITDNYAYFKTVINEFTGRPAHIKVGSIPWFMGYGDKILLFDELQFKPYLQRKDD